MNNKPTKQTSHIINNRTTTQSLLLWVPKPLPMSLPLLDPEHLPKSKPKPLLKPKPNAKPNPQPSPTPWRQMDLFEHQGP